MCHICALRLEDVRHAWQNLYESIEGAAAEYSASIVRKTVCWSMGEYFHPSEQPAAVP